MGGKYGVEQARKIVVAAATLGNAVEQAIPILVSGGLMSKLKLLSVIMDAAPAFAALATVDLAAFKAEVGELDDQDKAALVAAFKQSLDLSNDPLEVAIEEVVDVVAHAANLVQGLVSQIQKLIDLFKS